QDRVEVRRTDITSLSVLRTSMNIKQLIVPRLAKISITNRFRVVTVFLLSGLWSGMISGWLSRTPRLQTFLYVKGDIFLIPTYKYWTVFALVFSAALVVAYFVSRVFGWLMLSPTVTRQLLALLIVVTSPILLYVSTRANFLIATIYYLAF